MILISSAHVTIKILHACARVWMFEYLQRIKSPASWVQDATSSAPWVQGAGKSSAHMGGGPTAEHPLEVAGLQAGEDDDEHAGAHEYNIIPGLPSKHAGNGNRTPRQTASGVELSTRPSPHSFLPPAQVRNSLCVDNYSTILSSAIHTAINTGCISCRAGLYRFTRRF